MPICPNCSETNQSYYTSTYSSNCTPSVPECINTDATCVLYSGPILSFLGVQPGENLEGILIKLDEVFQTVSPEYGFSNILKQCFSTTVGDKFSGSVEFANTVINELCSLKPIVLLNTSKIAEIEAILSLPKYDIKHILNETSCSFLNILNSDSTETALPKVFAAICSLKSSIDISSIIIEGNETNTSTLSNFVTYVKNKFNSLPTVPSFNNVTTCLINPKTSSDSVESTVLNIIATLCSLKTSLTIPSITSDCIYVPNTFSEFYTKTYENIAALSKKSPSFNLEHFEVTPKTPVCNGVDVSLKPTVLGKVYTSSTDDLGYLEEKFENGTNTTVSITDNKLSVNVSGIVSANNGIFTINNAVGSIATFIGTNTFSANQSTNSTLTINVPPTNLGSSINLTTGKITITSSTGSSTELPDIVNTNIGNTNLVLSSDRTLNADNKTLNFYNLSYISFFEGVSAIFPSGNGFKLKFGGLSGVKLRTDYVEYASSGITLQFPNINNKTLSVSVDKQYANTTGDIMLLGNGTFVTLSDSTPYNVPITDNFFIVSSNVANTFIVMPNPDGSNIGREIRFKIKAVGICNFSGSHIPKNFGVDIAPFNGTTISLAVKSVNDGTGYFWEIISYNTVL